MTPAAIICLASLTYAIHEWAISVRVRREGAERGVTP